jgi:hypothetical protein
MKTKCVIHGKKALDVFFNVVYLKIVTLNP